MTVKIMNDFFKHRRWGLLFLVIVALCSGCAGNRYADFYTESQENRSVCQLKRAGYPQMVEILNLDEVRDWRKRSYEVVGVSSFYDCWESRTKAAAWARKKKTPLVLLYCSPEKEDQNASDYLHPRTPLQSPKKDSHWIFKDTSCDSRGASSASYGDVSGSFSNPDYTQIAYFMAPRKLKNDYGVYFVLPDKSSTKHSSSPIRVDVVIAGSQAEKDGVKPGDILVSINGEEIHDISEAEKYMYGMKKIEKLVVRHE